MQNDIALRSYSYSGCLIEKFGGSGGIRDKSLLESALSRPFQTFDGKDLYIDVIQKAAALIESIIKNHPFIDGNKRIGYVLMRLWLLQNGFDVKATKEEKYLFVIGIASGESDIKDISKWLNRNIQKDKR